MIELWWHNDDGTAMMAQHRLSATCMAAACTTLSPTSVLTLLTPQLLKYMGRSKNKAITKDARIKLRKTAACQAHCREQAATPAAQELIIRSSMVPITKPHFPCSSPAHFPILADSNKPAESHPPCAQRTTSGQRQLKLSSAVGDHTAQPPGSLPAALTSRTGTCGQWRKPCPGALGSRP